MQEFMPGVLRGNTWKDDFVWYFEVEKGGIYELKDLYMFLYQWFQKEYMLHWQSKDKYIEDFYLHRIKPDGVQANLIWWRATLKMNNWTYYMCKVDWQNYGAKPTEVMYNDKKVKAHKVGLVIRVWWWVQWDPWNKWEKSFLGKMSEWFHTYLLSNEMEDHRDKARVIAQRMENDMKTWFEMYTDTPQPRNWFPEEGFKYKHQKPDSKQFEHQERAPDWQI